MTPVQCRTCRHFIPWPSNPEQAVGECGKGHGYHFAGETHRCVDHESRPDMTSILMKIWPESKNKAV